MENNKQRPTRFQRCFRIAFNFIEERAGARGSDCSEAEFWRDTANLVQDTANQLGNDPLLVALLCACVEDLERLDKADRKALADRRLAHGQNKAS